MSIVPQAVQTMIDAARRDPEEFWDLAARELPWFSMWDRVFERGSTTEKPAATAPAK